MKEPEARNEEPQPPPESLSRELWALLFLYAATAVPALLYGWMAG